MAHVREYLLISSSHCGRNLILNNFSTNDAPFLFSVAVWNCEVVKSSVGFYITNSYSSLICAGCCSTHAESDIEADALALTSTLKCMQDLCIHCKQVFVANGELFKAIKINNS